jgi:hypothetical protein
VKKEIKDLWVKALESGEYPQGRNRLRSSEGLCCLGVLCDLHARAHPEIARLERDPFRYLGMGSTLPDEVMDWSGMTNDAGEFIRPPRLPKSVDKVHRKTTSLAALNDDGLTFKQIARVIRANWQDL